MGIEFGIFYLIISTLVISNIIHMVVVKMNWFSNLSVPIHKVLFGSNKTIRGFLIVPLVSAITFSGLTLYFISSRNWNGLLIGAILGFVYLLSELPNSFIKRRLHIDPGSRSKKAPFLFWAFDKMDSAFGIALVSKWLFELDALNTVLLFITSVIVHIVFSLLLLGLGLKKSF